MEAAKGMSAAWEQDNRSWLLTYEVDGKEVVYRWFERLDEPYQKTEGCQTITKGWVYQEWRPTE